MYRYPASYTEADVHSKATTFGYAYHELKSKEKVPICPCCDNLTSTMDIPICYGASPEQPKVGDPIFLLATDVSLYFTLIKVIIFYLVLKFLVVDAYIIYASLNGSYCPNLATLHKTNSVIKVCSMTYSGYNLNSASNQSSLIIIDILTCAFALISVIFFIFARKHVNRLRDWLDFNEISQDDYTVLMEGIPSFLYDKPTDTI